MPTLLTTAGHPVPPSDLVRRLRQVDPALDLKWFPSSGCWGITAQWRADDSRRARVRSGEVAEADAYDAVCFVREDVSAEDAFHFFVRGLRSASREDITKMLDRLSAWNDAHADALADAATAETLNQVEVMGHTLTGTAKQYQSAPSGGGKAHFGKGRKARSA